MSYESDEYYKVYREEIRKARKQHTCDACKRAILPGHMYCSLYTVDDEGTQSIKRCGACQKTHEHLRALCRQSNRNMWPDEKLGCGQRYTEEWGDIPDDIAALAFLSDDEAGKLLEKGKKKHDQQVQEAHGSAVHAAQEHRQGE